MRRSVLLVPVLAMAFAGIGACSSATTGSPVPGATTGSGSGPTSTQETTGETSSSSPSPSGAPLADKDPCTLLTPGAQAKFGVSGGQKHDVGEGRGCQWTLRGSSETTFFAVQIYDNSGIKDIPAESGPKQLPDIGAHKAVQTQGNGGAGTCSVILGVTDSSQVTSTVLSGTDTQKACDLAHQMAEQVEPELR